jgi:hypothetical protein
VDGLTATRAMVPFVTATARSPLLAGARARVAAGVDDDDAIVVADRRGRLRTLTRKEDVIRVGWSSSESRAFPLTPFGQEGAAWIETRQGTFVWPLHEWWPGHRYLHPDLMMRSAGFASLAAHLDVPLTGAGPWLTGTSAPGDLVLVGLRPTREKRIWLGVEVAATIAVVLSFLVVAVTSWLAVRSKDTSFLLVGETSLCIALVGAGVTILASCIEWLPLLVGRHRRNHPVHPRSPRQFSLRARLWVDRDGLHLRDQLSVGTDFITVDSRSASGAELVSYVLRSRKTAGHLALVDRSGVERVTLPMTMWAPNATARADLFRLLDSAGLTETKPGGQAARAARSFGPGFNRGLHVEAATGHSALQTRMLAPSVRLIALSLVGLVFLHADAGPTLEHSQTALLVGVATVVAASAVLAFTGVLLRLVAVRRSTSDDRPRSRGPRMGQTE